MMAKDNRTVATSMTCSKSRTVEPSPPSGSFGNPVELFAAYGIANVAGVLPVTTAGLGVVDSVAPLLLVSFGVISSVATLGVVGGRLVYSGCRSRSAPPRTSPSRCRAALAWMPWRARPYPRSPPTAALIIVRYLP